MATKREVFLELAEFASQELDEAGLDNLIFQLRAKVGYFQAVGISAAEQIRREDRDCGLKGEEDEVKIEIPETYRRSFTFKRSW